MENIRQAVERARANQSSSKSHVLETFGAPERRMDSSALAKNIVGPQNSGPQNGETELDSNYLLSRRIVSHDGADQRSRPYDMLRTQVLQAMGLKGWKILGVTSPTPGCGKTLTAINLAFSIGRQSDQSVALVDIDLQQPKIANYLGLITRDGGTLSLLEERATLQDALVPVRVANRRVAVLPASNTKQSSELMSSRAMRHLLQDLRKDYQTIILDLPPMLSSDDVIAVLPQMDCVLLVAAVGISKVSEIEECSRHLHSSQLLRLVLNKATDVKPNHY